MARLTDVLNSKTSHHAATISSLSYHLVRLVDGWAPYSAIGLTELCLLRSFARIIRPYGARSCTFRADPLKILAIWQWQPSKSQT